MRSATVQEIDLAVDAFLRERVNSEGIVDFSREPLAGVLQESEHFGRLLAISVGNAQMGAQLGTPIGMILRSQSCFFFLLGFSVGSEVKGADELDQMIGAEALEGRNQ